MSRRATSRRGPVQSDAAPSTPHFSDTGFSGITDHHTRNALSRVVAEEVTLTLLDGSVFSGIFSGTESVDRTPVIVLSYAKLKSGNQASLKRYATEVRGNVAAKLRVPVPNLVKLIAPFPLDHVLTSASTSASAGSGRGRSRAESRNFATDGQIAQRGHGSVRELKRFDDFTEITPPAATGTGSRGGRDAETFGDLASAPRNAAKWDQFQANEKQFGVRTSFNEDEYTTKIDRSSADYDRRQREAERIAAEIEAKPSGNIHVQEERNQPLTSNADEESRYSGVHRPSTYNASHSKTKPSHNGNSDIRSHAAQTENSSANTARQDVRSKNTQSSKGSTSTTKQVPIQRSLPPNKGGAAHKNSGPHRINPQKSVPTGKSAPAQKTVAPQKASTPPKNELPHKSGVPTKSVWGAKNSVSSKAMAPAKSNPTHATSAPPKLTTNNQPQNPASNSAQPNKPVGASKLSGPRLSYAAAAGAKAPRSAVVQNAQPVSSSTASASAHTSNPRSPVSPTKSSTNVKKLPASSLAGARDNSRMGNGGGTPPGHGRSSPTKARNSPLTSGNPETSAVNALSLEARTQIHKSFKEYKVKESFKKLVENRLIYTTELKQFSNDLDAKRSLPRRNSPQTRSAGAAKGKAAKQDESLDEQSQSTQKAAQADVSPTEKQLSAGAEQGSKKEAAVEESKTRSPQGAGKKEAAQSGSTSEKRKPKKLNPNAVAFMPSTPKSTAPNSNAFQAAPPSATPMTSTAPPVAPNIAPQILDPYMHMGGYASGATGVPEPQGAPNMGYPIPSGPMPHPHNLPYPPYQMMVPGAVAQAPGFGYMTGARPPYMMPGPGGNRFAPAPPSGMGFGIPVPIMPGQGNQRSGPYPQFYSGQYLSAQQPVPMQAGVPPPPFPHAQHAMPVGAPVVMSPRNNMSSGGSGGGSGGGGGGRRGGPKGRGRHGHHHHPQHHFGHHNGSSGDQHQSSYHHSHPQSGSGSHSSRTSQWIPVSQGDSHDKTTETASSGASATPSASVQESGSSRRSTGGTQAAPSTPHSGNGSAESGAHASGSNNARNTPAQQ